MRRHRLLAALLEAMGDQGIPLQLGKRLAAIHGLPLAATTQHSTTTSSSSWRLGKGAAAAEGGPAPGGPVTLEFEDGSSFEADLVVGCDGLRSKTRAIIKGREEAPPRCV